MKRAISLSTPLYIIIELSIMNGNKVGTIRVAHCDSPSYAHKKVSVGLYSMMMINSRKNNGFNTFLRNIRIFSHHSSLKCCILLYILGKAAFHAKYEKQALFISDIRNNVRKC